MKLVKKVKKKYHRFRTALLDKPLPLPTKKECVLIEELRATFSNLPVPIDDCQSQAGNKWNRFVQQLHALLEHNDPREFLRWDVILQTMCVLDAPWTRSEFDYLKADDNWQSI